MSERVHGWDKPMSNRLPVGPGSRGGLWHDRGFRSRWWAAYRRSNPQWGIDQRERRGRARRERAERVAARLPSFTQACALVLADEVAQHGYRAVGRRLAVEHTTVWRLIVEGNAPSGDLVDAIVGTYGLKRIHDKATAVERQVRSEERARARSDASVPAGHRRSPAPVDHPSGRRRPTAGGY